LPTPERMLDFLYVPTLVFLGLAGLGLYPLAARRPPRPGLLPGAGPVRPARLVHQRAGRADAQPRNSPNRSWPFHLPRPGALRRGWTLGDCWPGGLNSKDWGRRFAWPATARAGWRSSSSGASGIGDNQAGRFPGRWAPTKAAGPGDESPPDLTRRGALAGADRRALQPHRRRRHHPGGLSRRSASSARPDWGFLDTLLRHHAQRGLPSTCAAPTPATLVVDRRITQLPPRYGYYFSDAELYLPEAQVNGRQPIDPLPPRPARQIRTAFPIWPGFTTTATSRSSSAVRRSRLRADDPRQHPRPTKRGDR